MQASRAAAGPVAPPPEPAIAWEDEHLLVVDKPAGLVVHPGAGHAQRDARATRSPGRSPAATRTARASSTGSTATRRA